MFFLTFFVDSLGQYVFYLRVLNQDSKLLAAMTGGSFILSSIFIIMNYLYSLEILPGGKDFKTFLIPHGSVLLVPHKPIIYFWFVVFIVLVSLLFMFVYYLVDIKIENVKAANNTDSTMVVTNLRFN